MIRIPAVHGSKSSTREARSCLAATCRLTMSPNNAVAVDRISGVSAVTPTATRLVRTSMYHFESTFPATVCQAGSVISFCRTESSSARLCGTCWRTTRHPLARRSVSDPSRSRAARSPAASS
jgi:hypothetical protein